MDQQLNERKYQDFEFELFNPLRGHELSDLEQYVALLLIRASAERPITNDEICVSVELHLGQKVDQRTVKKVIRTLRKDHSFPIIANRVRPFGYWWCNSKSEMESYIETFRSQALDELHTLGRIVKANFPELAGQLRFDDMEQS
jgi:hypothetical protein